MKLRICGDRLRLRLSQAEVGRLGAGERLSETTHIGAGSSLVICVESSAEAKALAASLEGGRLTVVVPAGEAREWAQSDQVSISGSQTAGAGHQLELLVEKDFQCLHSGADEDAGAFPNPKQPGGR